MIPALPHKDTYKNTIMSDELYCSLEIWLVENTSDKLSGVLVIADRQVDLGGDKVNTFVGLCLDRVDDYLQGEIPIYRVEETSSTNYGGSS